MRLRRPWFPILWTVLLALGVGCLHFNPEGDPGVRNTVAFFAIGLAAFGIAFWSFFLSGWSHGRRWLLALIPVLIVYSYSPLGPIQLILNGDVGLVDWRWRWASAPDEKLAVPGRASATYRWETTPNDYPRFLGNHYWAEVKDVRLETDWKLHPPKEIWRKKIGAGWSAFAIVGDHAVTHEQRGASELVTCYKLLTGEIVWTHADPVRFDPAGGGALGGIGPRATPTIDGENVFTHGATGILNCLDARTGNLVWSHNTLAENNADNISWGKAGSPLVVDDLVVVSVGGTEGNSLVAYRRNQGELVWSAGDDRSSYASPVFAKIAGQRVILSVNEDFVTAHRLDNGSIVWRYEWPGNSDSNATTSQPIPLVGDQVFLSKGYGIGSSLLQLGKRANGEFEANPLWVKSVMKTKISNVLVHDGYVYGLDNGILQCIELASGKNHWKKRRSPPVGHGQVLLVGDTIVILTESGELLLVEASPRKYHELANLRVLPSEQVTWNNPAFAPPYLLVRNSQEAACYKIPLADLPPELAL